MEVLHGEMHLYKLVGELLATIFSTIISSILANVVVVHSNHPEAAADQDIDKAAGQGTVAGGTLLGEVAAQGTPHNSSQVERSPPGQMKLHRSLQEENSCYSRMGHILGQAWHSTVQPQDRGPWEQLQWPLVGEL